MEKYRTTFRSERQLAHGNVSVSSNDCAFGVQVTPDGPVQHFVQPDSAGMTGMGRNWAVQGDPKLPPAGTAMCTPA